MTFALSILQMDKMSIEMEKPSSLADGLGFHCQPEIIIAVATALLSFVDSEDFAIPT